MLKSGNKTSVEAEHHRAAVKAKVAENASFDEAYLVMNVLATVIASYGLLAASSWHAVRWPCRAKRSC